MLSRQDALSPITFIAERTLTNLAESQKSSTATQPLAHANRPAFADRLKKSQSKKPQSALESTSNSRPESAPSRKPSGRTPVRETSVERSAVTKPKQAETRNEPTENSAIPEEALEVSFATVNTTPIADADEENLDLESSNPENNFSAPETDHPVEVTMPLSLLSATAKRQQVDTSEAEALEEPVFSEKDAASLAPIAFFKALDQNKNSTESPLESQPVLSMEELQAAVKAAGSPGNTSSEVDVISQPEPQNQSTENEEVGEESPIFSVESLASTNSEAETEVQHATDQEQDLENQSESKQSSHVTYETPSAYSSPSQNSVDQPESHSEPESAKSNGTVQLPPAEDVVQEGKVELKTESQIEVHKKEQPTEVDSGNEDTSDESNSQQVSRYGNSSIPVTEHVNPQAKPSTNDVSGQTVSNPTSDVQPVTLETVASKISSIDEQSSRTRMTETNTLAAENRPSVSEGKAEVVRPVLDTSKSEVPQRLASFIQQAAEQGKALKIRLHPPELGTMQIEVNRLNGQVTAKIEVESAAARAVIFEQLGLLKDSLTQQGIKVDQLQVEINEQLANESGNSFSSESGSSDMAQDQQHQREQYGTTGVERDDTTEAEEKQNAPTSKIGVSEMDVQI